METRKRISKLFRPPNLEEEKSNGKDDQDSAGGRDQGGGEARNQGNRIFFHQVAFYPETPHLPGLRPEPGTWGVNLNVRKVFCSFVDRGEAWVPDWNVEMVFFWKPSLDNLNRSPFFFWRWWFLLDISGGTTLGVFGMLNHYWYYIWSISVKILLLILLYRCFSKSPYKFLINQYWFLLQSPLSILIFLESSLSISILIFFKTSLLISIAIYRLLIFHQQIRGNNTKICCKHAQIFEKRLIIDMSYRYSEHPQAPGLDSMADETSKPPRQIWTIGVLLP